MNEFPERVTLCEDGAYRWSYEMDMWHNRYLLKLVIKVLSLVLGIPLVFVAAMVLKNALPLLRQGVRGEQLMHLIDGDLLSLGIIAAIFAGCLLLTLLIYAICALVKGGVYRLCFAMNEEGVVLVRSTASQNTLDALSAIASVADLFSSRPSNTASTIRTANASGKTAFSLVRHVRQHPEWDVLDLREWFGMNQIYVRPEDYGFVRDFILAHVRESARG